MKFKKFFFDNDFVFWEFINLLEPVPKILCDENKIQQVLLHILKSVAQFMAQKEYEKSPSPTFIFMLFSKNKMVRLEIEDSGPGIDVETRRKVFEPFFTIKAVGVGNGLGLSVSYFIITENHKGKMGVVALLGKGSLFYIELPV